MHILNHCHGVLNLSRYNLIHDAVLKVSDEVVKENCPKEPGGTYSQTFQTLSTPSHLYHPNQWS